MKTRSQDAEFELSFTLLMQIRWCCRLQETHRKINICILTHGKEKQVSIPYHQNHFSNHMHNVCRYRTVNQYREKEADYSLGNTAGNG